MSNLVYSLGGVILLEIAAFFLLYRFTRWQGKHVAMVVAVFIVGLYLPIGILTWRSLDYFAIHFAFYIMIPYVLGIISTHWEVRRKESGASTKQQFFHWGPLTLVGFFIVLAMVDALILTAADKGVSTKIAKMLLPEPRSEETVSSYFPGAVSHDFQEKESQYNAFRERLSLQEARGWKVRKGWVGEPIAGEPALFKVAVADKAGEPVSGASITGSFLRPSDSRLDKPFTMEEVEPGVYTVGLTLNLYGGWSVAFAIDRDGELHEVRAATRVAPK